MDPYVQQHRRLAPVLQKARELDIATNPAPEAVFEAGSAGFQIWCTPQDHPGELWETVTLRMTQGAFSKPCEFTASLRWGWENTEDGPAITHLVLSTDAYCLRDCNLISSAETHNRSTDVVWAKAKVAWLFDQAGVPMPPIVVGN